MARASIDRFPCWRPALRSHGAKNHLRRRKTLTSSGVTVTAAKKDSILQLSIDAITPAGIIVDHRLICSGDERGLLPEESEAFAKSVIKRRQASGAARTVARELLERFGCSEKALPKSISGAPIWPYSFIGSLAHDFRVAIATV